MSVVEATAGWSFAARRRVFVWAPIALVAGCVFLATAMLANGPAVVAGLVMVAAAFGAVLDDRDDRPGWADEQEEQDMTEALMDDQARKDGAMALVQAAEVAVDRARAALAEADRVGLLEQAEILEALMRRSLELYPEAERKADEAEVYDQEDSAWPEDQLAAARRPASMLDDSLSRLDRMDGVGSLHRVEVMDLRAIGGREEDPVVIRRDVADDREPAYQRPVDRVVFGGAL